VGCRIMGCPSCTKFININFSPNGCADVPEEAIKFRGFVRAGSLGLMAHATETLACVPKPIELRACS
jgi:hypothetical protein